MLKKISKKDQSFKVFSFYKGWFKRLIKSGNMHKDIREKMKKNQFVIEFETETIGEMFTIKPFKTHFLKKDFRKYKVIKGVYKAYVSDNNYSIAYIPCFEFNK